MPVHEPLVFQESETVPVDIDLSVIKIDMILVAHPLALGVSETRHKVFGGFRINTAFRWYGGMPVSIEAVVIDIDVVPVDGYSPFIYMK